MHENTLLGMSLATWVERNVVDPMTGYQHSILRDSACQILHELQDRKSSDSIASQISRSLNIYPQVHQVLQLLLQLRTQAIDMGSLIRVPDEIYRSETEWFGNTLSSTGKVKKEDSMEVDAQGSNVATKPNGISSMEQLDRVFAYVANAIVSYDKLKCEQVASQMKVDEVSNPTVPEEDPVLRNIRLNLLALVSVFLSDLYSIFIGALGKACATGQAGLSTSRSCTGTDSTCHSNIDDNSRNSNTPFLDDNIVISRLYITCI